MAGSPPFYIFTVPPALSSDRGRRYRQLIGRIAQLVEHRADNAGVSGSIPLAPIFRVNDLDQERPALLGT